MNSGDLDQSVFHRTFIVVFQIEPPVNHSDLSICLDLRFFCFLQTLYLVHCALIFKLTTRSPNRILFFLLLSVSLPFRCHLEKQQFKILEMVAAFLVYFMVETWPQQQRE